MYMEEHEKYLFCLKFFLNHIENSMRK